MAVVALIGTVFASAAQAKTVKPVKPVKPVCNLITDPAGDAYAVPQVLVGGPTGGPTDNSSDIVSGDIASNKTTITVVFRVVKLTTPDPFSPLGQVFTFVFLPQHGSDPVFIAAGLYPTGNKFDFGWYDTSSTPRTFNRIGAASGVVDTVANELRVSVPLALFNTNGHAKVVNGLKIAGLDAQSGRFSGQEVADRPSALPSAVPFFHGLISQVDDAPSSKVYVAGAPSCVKVGA